jgi:VacB/RNase II family 3'-5' exoribonuclease
MNVDEKARKSLADGFSDIVAQFQLPGPFSDALLAETDRIISGSDSSGHPNWRAGRRDATDLPLVTLDPASSTDLDQAFALAKDGNSIVLYYALADVGAFVNPGSLIEQEAWQRGVTIYGLSEKIPLYPKQISQGAASLLPSGDRPSILVTISIRPDGTIDLREIERVICASRAKLAYDTVDMNAIPHLNEFATRMWNNEAARGAIRVEFPQQEVVSDPQAPGGVKLELRARNNAESVNSTLSLAVNLAIADLFLQNQTGVFRVMDEPTPRSVDQLRRAAHALNIDWHKNETLRDLQRRMDPTNATHQRFLLDARRSGGRATYTTFDPDKKPWHSAMAATYTHATAPMRRLADRYVLDLAECLASQRKPTSDFLEKLNQLPDAMLQYETRANNVDRAVIDLLEAVALQNRIGEVLTAEVIDSEASIVQTEEAAIRARVQKLPKQIAEGQKIRVRIESADPVQRRVTLTFTEIV